MRNKPIQMGWEVEVEVENNFKQQLHKATWKKNLSPIWTQVIDNIKLNLLNLLNLWYLLQNLNL
jgi:hypothetical protein